MAKTIIQTDNAPQAIGTYSQAVKVDNTVYISGQIPLDPASMEVVAGGTEEQITRVFDNPPDFLQLAEDESAVDEDPFAEEDRTSCSPRAPWL